MLRAIRSDKPGFKSAVFKSGLNLVVSDTTLSSTKKDTRNSTGKSSLIDILHFCLGANVDANSTLSKKELQDYSFSIDLDILGEQYTISRSISDPSKIQISGNVAKLGFANSKDKDQVSTSVPDFRTLMGKMMFGLPKKETAYTPTFRALISYFVRRLSRGGSHNPFENFVKQPTWDMQVNNAYLLGLNWEDAERFQKLKDKEKRLENLKEIIREKIIPEMSEDIGKLESEKVRLDESVSELKNRITNFKVHENYKEIELEANTLTEKIHRITDLNFELRRSISLYLNSLEAESAPETEYLEMLYQEAKITLPEIVKKNLNDARTFHSSLISNRKTFLTHEIKKLESIISENDANIKMLSEKRAEKMGILRTHGALSEYTLLTEQYSSMLSKATTLSQKIDELKRFNQGKNAVKAEKVQLENRALENHQEIKEIWQDEIKLFNTYSMKLYESPGDLIININQTGFKFDIRILRGEGQGFGKMKIFCYDLVLGTLWTKREFSPGFIVHDSSIFDGVDGRQVAHALELASELSSKEGFQYICCMNSDAIPKAELSPGFSIDEFIRLRLDDTESGALFGFRF